MVVRRAVTIGILFTSVCSFSRCVDTKPIAKAAEDARKGAEALSQATKQASDRLEAAAKEARTGMEKASQNAVTAADNLDPVAIKKLLDEVEKQRLENKRLFDENQGLRQELAGLIVKEVIGTYKDLAGKTCKVEHIAGNQFRFTDSNGNTEDYSWEKESRLFV
jgi:hypothetical protein